MTCGPQPRFSSICKLAFAALALASCCACKSDRGAETDSRGGSGTTLTVHNSEGQSIPINVEVVATDDARQKGLMFRRDLADGDGMLFVFPDDSDHSFWMKNTYISLDIVFVGSDKTIVGIVHKAKPRSEASLTVGVRSRYVLEVPGSYCSRMGIHRGDRLDFEL